MIKVDVYIYILEYLYVVDDIYGNVANWRPEFDQKFYRHSADYDELRVSYNHGFISRVHTTMVLYQHQLQPWFYINNNHGFISTSVTTMVLYQQQLQPWFYLNNSYNHSFISTTVTTMVLAQQQLQPWFYINNSYNYGLLTFQVQYFKVVIELHTSLNCNNFMSLVISNHGFISAPCEWLQHV